MLKWQPEDVASVLDFCNDWMIPSELDELEHFFAVAAEFLKYQVGAEPSRLTSIEGLSAVFTNPEHSRLKKMIDIFDFFETLQENLEIIEMFNTRIRSGKSLTSVDGSNLVQSLFQILYICVDAIPGMPRAVRTFFKVLARATNFRYLMMNGSRRVARTVAFFALVFTFLSFLRHALKASRKKKTFWPPSEQVVSVVTQTLLWPIRKLVTR